jgi:SAM-dependent methyltransferase
MKNKENKFHSAVEIATNSERARCNVCLSDESRIWKSFGCINLVECEACGLLYMHPVPDDIYKRYETGDASPFEYYVRNQKADIKTFSYILRILSNYKTSGRLLDVGCGVGTFMAMCRDMGFQVKGVDINQHCLEYCQRTLSLDVEYGLSGQNEFDCKFDIVTFLNVIEHLKDPSGTLRLIRNTLVDKGIILITTMNIESWAAKEFQVKPLEHLYYFNPITIKKILANTGFNVLDLKIYDPYRDLSSLFFSSTFSERPIARFILNIFRKILRERKLLVKFPLRENMLIIAEKTQ